LIDIPLLLLSLGFFFSGWFFSGWFFSGWFFNSFSFSNNDFFDWGVFNSNNWVLSSFSSNNTCFNGISNDLCSSCCGILSSHVFGTHTIINSSFCCNLCGNLCSNFLNSFSLCKFSIRTSLSWCSDSFGSNFLDGSTIFSSGSKSFFLSGLDLFGLSCISSDNFSDGNTSSFSGSNSSGNLNFSNFLNSFSLCKFSIRTSLSWCSDSFGSNFLDGSTIFSSGSKSFFLSGLDLFGLSIISSSSFNCSFKGSFSGKNRSSFFRGLIGI
jgi:hypothetical protein